MKKLTYITISGLVYGFTEGGLQNFFGDYLQRSTERSTSDKRDGLKEYAAVVFNPEMQLFLKVGSGSVEEANKTMDTLRDIGLTVNIKGMS